MINIWIGLLAILMGLSEIRYAYKVVEKDDRQIKKLFIVVGIITILCGLWMWLR